MKICVLIEAARTQAGLSTSFLLMFAAPWNIKRKMARRCRAQERQWQHNLCHSYAQGKVK